jgi:hypothetical protein
LRYLIKEKMGVCLFEGNGEFVRGVVEEEEEEGMFRYGSSLL